MQGIFGFEVSIKVEMATVTILKTTSYAGALVAILIIGLLVFLAVIVLFILQVKNKIDLLQYFRPKPMLVPVVTPEQRKIKNILEMSIQKSIQKRLEIEK